VRLMHSKGAALDYKNEKGKTPLMIAIAFQRHNLIAYLIENGADVKARCGPGHAQCPMPNAHARRVASTCMGGCAWSVHGACRRSTGRACRFCTSRAGSAISR
jgi:hypothetical protein